MRTSHLVFACYERSCRPPTSGGTGGSSRGKKGAIARAYSEALLSKGYGGRAAPDGIPAGLDKIQAARRVKLGKPQITKEWQEAHKVWQSAIPKAQIRIGTSPETLEAILTEGFRTQRELGSSSKGAALEPAKRDKVESQLFGWPATESPNHNVIYGHLYDPSSSEYALRQKPWAYGKASIKLKNAIRDYTTITMGDSLTVRNTPAPLPLNGKKSLEDLYYATPQPTYHPQGKPKYIEAQIHKRLTPNDIEEVEIFGDFDYSALAKAYPHIKFTRESIPESKS